MDAKRDNATEDYTRLPSSFAMEPQQKGLKTAEAVLHGVAVPKEIGNYVLGAEIGRGGMGVVYQAVEKELGRVVAIKILPHTRSGSNPLARFQVESRAAAQLSHDNIVPVYATGEQAGLHYYVMKFIQGVNFSELIKDIKRALKSSKQGEGKNPSKPSKPSTKPDKSHFGSETLKNDSFPNVYKPDFHSNVAVTRQIVHSVASVGVTVASALHHAHERGVIHRDIKPSNLMFDEDGKIWVTDFGLAHIQGDSALTQTGDLIGTLRYMSPEQAAGRRAFVDNRTDIYSLGVTLFELATLRYACRGTTAREILHEVTFTRPVPLRKINPHIPKEFETIIYKATERNPEDRYRTALELATDLQRFLQGQSLLAPRVTVIKRFQNWFTDHPITTLCAGICLLITLLTSSIAAATLLHALSVEQDLNLQQRQMLTKSEGQKAMILSSLVRDADPGLAVALAIKGAEAFPGIESDQALLMALDNLHEVKALQFTEPFRGAIVSSRNGRLIARSGTGNAVGNRKLPSEIMDWQTGIVQPLDTSPMPSSAVFSGDDKFLLTSSSSFSPFTPNLTLDEVQFGEVKLWDVKSHRLIKNFANARQLYCRPDSFSTDGERLVLATKDGNACVYDTADWSRKLILRSAEAQVLQAGFNRRGDQIATWDTAGKLIVWDAQGNQLVVIDYPKTRPLATDFEFAPHLNMIVVFGASGLKCVNLGRDGPESVLSLPERFATFDPTDDKLCVANFARGRLQLFRMPSAQSMADRLWSHPIADLKFAANGAQILVANGQEIDICDANSGEVISTCRGHQNTIQSLAVGPNDNFFSLDADGMLRVWNVRSNRQQRTIPVNLHPGTRLIVDQADDGKSMLVATVSQPLSKIIDLTAPEKPAIDLSGLCASSIAKTSACVTHNAQDVTLWNPSTSRKLAETKLPHETVHQCDHSEAQSSVIIRALSGALYQWNYAVDSLELLTQVAERALSHCLSSDGRNCCVGMSSGKLVIFDLETGKRSAEYPLEGSILSVEFNEAGDKILAVQGEEVANIVAVENGDSLARFNRAGSRFDTAIWCADDQEIVTLSRGLDVREMLRWRVSDQQIVAETEVEHLRDFRLAADGISLALATTQGAFVWNLETDERTELTKRACNQIEIDSQFAIISTPVLLSRMQSDAADPDTAGASNRAELTIIDREIKEVKFNTRLEFMPTSVLLYANRLLVSGYSLGAQVNALETGELTYFCGGHAKDLLFGAFGPAQNSVWTVSKEGVVRVHNASGESRMVGEHQAAISSVAISPDRSQLLTSDTQGILMHWDLIKQQYVRTLENGGNPLSQLSFGADSVHVLSTSDEPNVKLWDLRTGDFETLSFQDNVLDAELSPDGQNVLAVVGERKIAVAPSNYLQTESDANKPRVVVMELASKAVKKLNLDGACVTAKYSPLGSFIAHLDSQGQVTLITNDADLITRKIPDKRMTSFYFAANEELLVTTSSQGTFVWETKTGRQRGFSVDDQALGSLATGFRNFEGAIAPDLKWRLMIDKDVIKIPVDILSYAREQAPRELTSNEFMRYQFLESIEEKN